MGNLFLQPLATVVALLSTELRESTVRHALLVDRQGNVELLAVRTVADEQTVARRGGEFLAFLSRQIDRRGLALLLVDRMRQLVEKARA